MCEGLKVYNGPANSKVSFMRRSYDTIATLYFELDYTLQSIKTFRDKCVCVCVCVCVIQVVQVTQA